MLRGEVKQVHAQAPRRRAHAAAVLTLARPALRQGAPPARFNGAACGPTPGHSRILSATVGPALEPMISAPTLLPVTNDLHATGTDVLYDVVASALVPAGARRDWLSGEDAAADRLWAPAGDRAPRRR